ncbi:MAG: hypothetical protein GC165_09975 [Armatimonadetes bacterium]|nr:hypothetical protein [Armatimonadota bacterium]
MASASGGYFKFDISTSDVKVTGGAGNSDQMKKMMEGQHQTMLIDKYGSVKADPKAGGNAGMQAIMKSLGNNAIGVAFPKKPVKIGETWAQTIDLGAIMKTVMASRGGTAPATTGTIKIVYKLVKFDGKTATIGSTTSGTMNMDMGAGKASAKGQSMKMSMTISGTSTSVLERSTGLPLSTTMKMTMGFMGNNIPMSTTMKRI